MKFQDIYNPSPIYDVDPNEMNKDFFQFTGDRVFTLSKMPVINSLMVSISGLVLHPTVNGIGDYTLSGNMVIINENYPINFNADVNISYKYNSIFAYKIETFNIIDVINTTIYVGGTAKKDTILITVGSNLLNTKNDYSIELHSSGQYKIELYDYIQTINLPVRVDVYYGEDGSIIVEDVTTTSGTYDTYYPLTYKPNFASEIVTLDGLLLENNLDYIISGKTLKLLPNVVLQQSLHLEIKYTTNSFGNILVTPVIKTFIPDLSQWFNYIDYNTLLTTNQLKFVWFFDDSNCIDLENILIYNQESELTNGITHTYTKSGIYFVKLQVYYKELMFESVERIIINNE